MRLPTFFFAIVFSMPALAQGLITHTSQRLATAMPRLNHDLLGTPVFMQIFKEERTLELYGKVGDRYQLLNSFKICKFSGGLGPKRTQGDFKSPEGFYTVRMSQLKPDSHYYRAINLGFPNQYDRENGYSGSFLMIHGDCVSAGCFAMTNAGIDQIYQYVDAALNLGQTEIHINIYPFRMTDENMRQHSIYSSYIGFWKQLKPGYDWFEKNHQPPPVSVINARYVLNGLPPQPKLPPDSPSLQQTGSTTVLTFTQIK